MENPPKLCDIYSPDEQRNSFEIYRKGFIRYEKLRKLNPRQFMELWAKCLNENVNFDQEFDQEVDKLEG